MRRTEAEPVSCGGVHGWRDADDADDQMLVQVLSPCLSGQTPELLARIQYATQQHFFGVLAEKYFDDMNNDVQITGRRHQQRSVDGYNRLPDVFTKEDVMKCFGYDKPRSALKKIERLRDSKYIEAVDKTDQFRKLVQMLTA